MGTWGIGFFWGAVAGVTAMLLMHGNFSDTVINGIFALLGVAAGGLLTIGHERWRRGRQNTILKLALLDELKLNQFLLGKRREVMGKAIAARAVGLNADVKAPPFSFVMFDENFPKVMEAMSATERNSLYIITERCKRFDSLMTRINKLNLDSRSEEWLDFYVDLNKGLDVTEDLIRKHLAGTPVDVVATDLQW